MITKMRAIFFKWSRHKCNCTEKSSRENELVATVTLLEKNRKKIKLDITKEITNLEKFLIANINKKVKTVTPDMLLVLEAIKKI